MNKDLITYIRKAVIFASPVIVLAVSYFIFDPFHVIRTYDSYPDNYLKSYNRNRISTQIFLNNTDQFAYRSFIFGSSRSSVFYTKDWGTYIGDSLAYHFDASNEDIEGIAKKLSFIEQNGNRIENVLLIFDGETFAPSVNHGESIIHIRDSRWSGEHPFLYQLHFFKAFFKDLYFVKYFDTLLFGVYRPYMYGSFENKHMLYTPVHNDFIFQGYIDRIKEDSLKYYQADLFYKRSEAEQTSEPLIGQNLPERKRNFGDVLNNFLSFGPKEKTDMDYLNEIKQIFERNKTSYRIVFGPNYDQKKVNPRDLQLVQDLFGTENVFDFTGKNALTEPLSNYYEIYHYKPVVAREIMRTIYRKD